MPLKSRSKHAKNRSSSSKPPRQPLRSTSRHQQDIPTKTSASPPSGFDDIVLDELKSKFKGAKLSKANVEDAYEESMKNYHTTTKPSVSKEKSAMSKTSKAKSRPIKISAVICIPHGFNLELRTLHNAHVPSPKLIEEYVGYGLAVLSTEKRTLSFRRDMDHDECISWLQDLFPAPFMYAKLHGLKCMLLSREWNEFTLPEEQVMSGDLMFELKGPHRAAVKNSKLYFTFSASIDPETYRLELSQSFPTSTADHSITGNDSSPGPKDDHPTTVTDHPSSASPKDDHYDADTDEFIGIPDSNDDASSCASSGSEFENDASEPEDDSGAVETDLNSITPRRPNTRSVTRNQTGKQNNRKRDSVRVLTDSEGHGSDRVKRRRLKSPEIVHTNDIENSAAVNNNPDIIDISDSNEDSFAFVQDSQSTSAAAVSFPDLSLNALDHAGPTTDEPEEVSCPSFITRGGLYYNNFWENPNTSDYVDL